MPCGTDEETGTTKTVDLTGKGERRIDLRKKKLLGSGPDEIINEVKTDVLRLET